MTSRDSLNDVYRISIPEVRPHLGCGRYAIKRVVGDTLRVTADVTQGRARHPRRRSPLSYYRGRVAERADDVLV